MTFFMIRLYIHILGLESPEHMFIWYAHNDYFLDPMKVCKWMKLGHRVAKCIRKVGSSKSPDKSRARIDSNVLNKINLEAVHTAGLPVAKITHIQEYSSVKILWGIFKLTKQNII